MVSKVRAMLDAGFLVGLAFALFLAGKIVPYLVIVGVLPVVLFWKSSDFAKPSAMLARFLLPTVSYFSFCLLLMYVYPGLEPGQEPPNNPDLELYAVAVALLAVGFLRGQQIDRISDRFQTIVPMSLLGAFAVLSFYMFLGIDGCRVKVAAAWPFIPALLFATLTFLLLLRWEEKTRSQQYLRLLLIALSIVVTVAYTGSRGVAVGQCTVMATIVILRCFRRFRHGLPKVMELSAAVGVGLIVSLLVGSASGCSSFKRWPALLQVVSDLSAPKHEEAMFKPTAEARTDGNISEDAVPPASTVTRKSAIALTKDGSIGLRLGMWIVSWDAIRDAPVFGHGALSLRRLIEDRFGFEHNHNQYLAWLVTGGAVFLAFGLFFLFAPVLMSKGLASVDRAVITLSITGLWGVALIFDAFLSLDFYLHYFSLLLGFLFALIADMAKMQSQHSEYV